VKNRGIPAPASDRPKVREFWSRQEGSHGG